jgi:predicted Zn-ribbon and HTH transcriptional regulator
MDDAINVFEKCHTCKSEMITLRGFIYDCLLPKNMLG